MQHVNRKSLAKKYNPVKTKKLGLEGTANGLKTPLRKNPIQKIEKIESK